MPDSATVRLSDDEVRLLASLLRRYCDHDLDQFEHWRMDTAYGEVFVDIGRHPASGASTEAYPPMG